MLLAGYLSEQARTAPSSCGYDEGPGSPFGLSAAILSPVFRAVCSHTLDRGNHFLRPAAGVIWNCKHEPCWRNQRNSFPGIQRHETSEGLSRWEEQFRRPDGAFGVG